MMKAIRCSLLAAGLVGGLTACGGDGGGEGVKSKAQAAALTQAMGQTMSSMGEQGSGLTAAGATSATEMEADCPEGGSVKFKSKADLDNIEDLSQGGEIKLAYSVDYKGCKTKWDNPDTSAVEEDAIAFDGEYTVKLDLSSSGSNAGAFAMEMKGKVKVSGSVSDELEMDLKYALETSGSDYSLTLDGFMKTSSEKFEFDNETFTAADFGAGHEHEEEEE